MARYPAVPKIYDYLKDNPQADRVHREISQWGAALVNQLDTRVDKIDKVIKDLLVSVLPYGEFLLKVSSG